MNPGKLNIRVTILDGKGASDGMGGYLKGNIPITECWAMIRLLKADEKSIASGSRLVASHRMVVRDNPLIKTNHQVRDQYGTLYDIQGIAAIHRKKGLVDYNLIERR